MTEQNHTGAPGSPRLHVSLFVTCLADLFRPSVAFATIKLLEQAGCDVDVPLNQTCCGQPSYNSGDYAATVPLAQAVIALLEPADYIVVPSGSCAGMISHHYPKILENEWRDRAIDVAAKTFELTAFLTDVVQIKGPPSNAYTDSVTYLDSCAGLRELGVKNQPRALLKEMCGVTVRELEQSEVCCGFGGTFCTKMPEISAKMTDDKIDNAMATGAHTLVGGDLGCLMSLAGRAQREGRDIDVRHVAELLSGDLDAPPIGQGE